jgi:hypothetical protein
MSSDLRLSGVRVNKAVRGEYDSQFRLPADPGVKGTTDTAYCGVSLGKLVRRDREVRADLDVVDTRRRPVPPLLVPRSLLGETTYGAAGEGRAGAGAGAHPRRVQALITTESVPHLSACNTSKTRCRSRSTTSSGPTRQVNGSPSARSNVVSRNYVVIRPATARCAQARAGQLRAGGRRSGCRCESPETVGSDRSGMHGGDDGFLLFVWEQVRSAGQQRNGAEAGVHAGDQFDVR